MAFYIIETKEQLDKLPITPNCFIDLVTNSDETHSALANTSAIYYNNFEKGFILTVNHTEGFSLDLKDIQNFLAQHEKVYLLDGKYHSYHLPLSNAVDLHFTAVDLSLPVDSFNCDTAVHKDFYYKHQYNPNINTLIPISKHYERCECMFEGILPLIGKEQNLAQQNAFINAYKWVEEQGIKINEKIFDKYFEPTWKANSVRDGKIYTKYNMYNVTSRPTNAYNGLNFLALPKDKSRAAFVPSNDKFIEFDFDGYHLRLIANKIDFSLPSDVSIHTYLGRIYFGREDLTDEEYQESKKITFRQLYNGIESKYLHIEFFKKVQVFVDRLYSTAQNGGYLELPNGRRIDPTGFSPQKLFNYYVQCLETVNNVEKLTKLKKLLYEKKSKVILVVYDSILIDFALDEGKELLGQIRDILQENGYLVKVKIGGTYDFS